MITIASYPRSGSTYLRFILCNIFYPEVAHNFDSVNGLIPTIENESEVSNNKYRKRIFYKTHDKRAFANAYLIRHVGDTIISEYYYQKKFFGINQSLEDWTHENNYGEHWRDFVNHYFGCYLIKYEDLILHTFSVVESLLRQLRLERNITEYAEAINKCTINKIRDIEKVAGFPNDQIHFVRDGSTGQWNAFSEEIKSQIISKNKRELTLLGYL